MTGINLHVGNVDFSRIDGFTPPVQGGLVAAHFLRKSAAYAMSNVAAGYSSVPARVLNGSVTYGPEYITFSSGQSAVGTGLPDVGVWTAYALMKRGGVTGGATSADNAIILGNRSQSSDTNTFLLFTVINNNTIGVSSTGVAYTSVGFPANKWCLMKFSRNGNTLTIANLTEGTSGSVTNIATGNGVGVVCLGSIFGGYTADLKPALFMGYNRATSGTEDAAVLAYANKYIANHTLT